MSHKHDFKKGFSLIELVVVMSITAIITGMGVNVYKNSVNERRLNLDVNLVVGIIEETKQKARARDVSPVATCNPFDSYNLVINPSANTLRQEIVCNFVSTQLTTYTLENTTITSPVGNTTLNFISPTGQTTNAELSITLRNTAISRCVTIRVPPIQTVIVSDPFSC